tara:strand:+ start:6430 stop:7311 length:882 start_codon:yes stop_codon:yes gene_type:complete
MKDHHTYGGQAVIEGVMIRGKKHVSVAVRRPDTTIAIRSEPLYSLFTGKLRNIPFIRGFLVLIEILILGMRSLAYSANVAAEAEEEELGKFTLGVMITISLLFSIVLFFLTPVFISNWLESFIKSHLIVNLIEGLIRVFILVAYLFLIGRMNDIKRVFMYHGAEHMAVHARENNDELNILNLKKYSTAHPRCGTAFILVVAVVSVFIFVFLGREPFWWLLLSRIIFVPIIASISYEIIRFNNKFSNNFFLKFIVGPSLALQSLTTREPDDKQLEIALVAINKTIELDNQISGL